LAQTTEEGTLTLDQCIAIAIQQNPLVLSSMQQYQASLARVNQAKAFPQPYLYYMTDYQSKFLDFKGAEESYLGLGSAIEFPGKRSIRGKIATKESDEIMQDIELLKLDIVFQVKQAFFGLLLAQEKLGYAQQNLELSQDFQNKAEMKFEAGDVAKVEALRARVEASKAANVVRAASNKVRLAKARLNFLLARKKYAPLEITGELRRPPASLDLDELIQRAFSFRPEIKRIDFSLEKENLRKKQGYLSYLPDFDLSISRHHVQNVPSSWSYILTEHI
jgi:outer membrane protein TolC